MGVVQVETFDVDVASSGQLHALTNPLPSINYGFVRNTNPRGHSGGPVGNTSNSGPDDMSGYAFVASTTHIELGRQLNSVKMMGEVWRYTGAPGGPDEFIVRDRLAVTLTNGGPSTGNAVAGVVDRNRTVCFITGKTCTQSSDGASADLGAIAYLDENGDLTVERGTGTSTLVVYVTVVEFVGINWVVNYAKFPFSGGSKLLWSDSTGATGIPANVDWSKTMIVESRQSGGDGSNDAIEDMSFTCYEGTSSTVNVEVDPTAGNTGNGFIFTLSHHNFVVARQSIAKNITNNNSYVSETFPAITLSSASEAALEWSVYSDGSGTAHGRGALSAVISDSITIQSWVHRSGNNGAYRYGVVDLSAVTGVASLTIASVDGDNILQNTQDGVIIAGVAFGVLQGSGTVHLSDSPTLTGTFISQTVTSWADESITIDFAAGPLTDSYAYIVVTGDDASVASFTVQVGAPPLSYTEAVSSLLPDHHWPLDGDYADLVNSLDWIVRSGAPAFAAQPLCRGRSQSWAVDNLAIEAGPDNSSFINDGTIYARTMGGWVRLSQVQDSFTMLYEEGGSVNNLAVFLGIGNILIAQYADAGDDNVHAYSDFPLEPNRNYHIAFRFDHGGTRLFELLIDGVVQQSTYGNPLTSGDLDSHTGDIAFGGGGETLQVFGTIISFPGAIVAYYQDWVTWTRYILDNDVRHSLFAQGCIGDIQITPGTQAEMQAALDAYANTSHPNSDCVFRIGGCSEGSFTLDFDNVTFASGTTFQVLYLGVAPLTIRNLNGSNLDTNKTYPLNGGSITILTPATLTITNIAEGSEVRVYEAGTQNEVGGSDSVVGGTFITSVSTNSVDVRILALGYQNLKITNVDTSSDTAFPVSQIVDRQYRNPV